MLLHLVREDWDAYQPWPECHSDSDERQYKNRCHSHMSWHGTWPDGPTVSLFLWWICSCCPYFFSSTNIKIFFFLTRMPFVSSIAVSPQRCQGMQELVCITHASDFLKSRQKAPQNIYVLVFLDDNWAAVLERASFLLGSSGYLCEVENIFYWLV